VAVKLLLVHQVFTLPGEGGGTRHYELARYLQADAVETTVITSDVKYMTGRRLTDHRRLVTEETVDGIRILRAWTYAATNASYLRRVFSFVSFMLTSLWAGLVEAGRPDLVWGTSPPLFQAVTAWLLAALRRRPFLLEIRDLWPEFAIGMGVLKNRLLIWLSRRLELFLYARATHLMVNSPAYRDYLKGKGVPEGKISLIPNGVDPDMFNPENRGAWVREKYDLHGKFVVTYAGALGQANDIPAILRAAARLRDEPRVHFLLVGDGKERPSLERQAAEMGLSNLTFLPWASKSEMADILGASDACLATLMDIPMFRTTYPNKVFDYMAAGRPTILAIDGVIRKVIEDAEGGVAVACGDEAAIAAAVGELSRDPERCRRLGAQARRHVVAHFNRHDQAAALSRLLRRWAT